MGSSVGTAKQRVNLGACVSVRRVTQAHDVVTVVTWFAALVGAGLKDWAAKPWAVKFRAVANPRKRDGNMINWAECMTMVNG